MLFSSMTFIFIFLPVVILLCLLTKQKFHNFILLIASILFYAFGEPKYVLIMLSIILISYLGSILIDKFPNHKKLLLFLTVITDLSFLIYYKYFNFLISNLNLIGGNFNFIKVVMPIGISFYTFQALSYVIDVYRGKVKVQRNIYKLALYICLFPQLVAGPIIKYNDIAEQIDSREINFDKVNTGIKRFIIGLSKKMLIANTMGAIADKIFIQDPTFLSHPVAWLGAFAYTFQLYFDFSGYSDMAIGLGLIFGFKFMENFNYPYISKSISEFWRRWHISLSTWFKEYVYIPLGGNKEGLFKTIRNLGLVFLLTGIWHGAAWNFVLWGLWNGFFVIFEKLINLKEIQQKYSNIILSFILHIYCIFVFVLGWVLFRSPDVKYCFKYLSNMFGFMKIDPNHIIFDIGYYIDLHEIIIFIAAIILSIPIFKNILEQKSTFKTICLNVWLIFLFILSVATISADTYNPFIYFRF